MVRIAATLIGAAILFSGLTGAAPMVKRQSSSSDAVAVSAAGSTDAATSTDPGILPVVSAVSAPDDTSDDSSDDSDDSGDDSSDDDSDATDASDATSTDGSDLSTLSAGGDVTFPTGSAGGDVSFTSTVDSLPTGSSYSPPSYSPPSYSPPSYSPSYSTPQYGSSSSSWQSDYLGCIEMCVAQYTPPTMGQWYPSGYDSVSSGSVSSGSISSGSDSSIDSNSSDSDDVSSDSDDSSDVDSDSSDSDSSDATSTSSDESQFTVIVAPMKGVLRFVPFTANLNPGQTALFSWGAGPHTVTQSSELTPCNKTLAPGAFASGMQEAGFQFPVTINDTNPVFFYCGVPTHCEKGMFGIINPPNVANNTDPSTVPTSVASMMDTWTNSSAPLMAAFTYVQNLTSNDTAAATWGNSMDMASIDPSFHIDIAANILLTRAVAAMNPNSIGADGNLKVSAGMSLPTDLFTTLSTAPDASAAPGYSTDGAATSSSASAASSGSPIAAASSPKPNGASALVSSPVTIAVAAVVAVFFAL